MVLLQTLRAEKDRVLEGLSKRGFRQPELVEQILQEDEARRALQAESDKLAAEINSASKKIGQLMAAGNKAEAEELKSSIARNKEAAKEAAAKSAAAEEALHSKLVLLPNIPHSSVAEGRTPEENVTVRTGGPEARDAEGLLPHWELAARYKLIDFELGNKITGAGFPVYTGQGARLQRALINYFIDYNTAAGYAEYQPPFVVNADSGFGTGQLPDKEGQMYHVTEDGFYLIPTAEVPLTNIFRDTITPLAELPMRLTGYTPCFRREAGSYGKDVRGLNRLHQFDKVEIVQMVEPETSYAVLEDMVVHVEGLLQALGLRYRVLRLCGGDMGFASALTYDFEVWSSAQDRWLEVSSVSNFETFQTGRMKARYRTAEGKTALLHSLNGSSLALPRIVATLLEQYQDGDGVALPAVLHSYFGKERIS